MLRSRFLPPPVAPHLVLGMALLFSALLASCQKEESTVTTVTLIAEEFQNDTKFAVDGVHSYWCNSDKVRINDNGEMWVSAGTDQATVSGSFTTPLRALSPASLTTSDLTSDAISVDFPATYQYSTTYLNGNTYQHVQTPMAAYAIDGNELQFKHLTGALMVKVTNSTTDLIYLESITISSDKYKLNGLRPINFTNLTTNSLTTSDDPEKRTVTMRFDNTTLSIPNYGVNYKYVQIPVPPVGDDQHFTVTVKYRNSGSGFVTGKHCYTKTLTQSGSSNKLLRGQMGYVPFEATTSGTGVTEDYFFTDGDYYVIADKWQLLTLGNVSGNIDFPSDAKIKITNNITMTYNVINPIQNVIELDGGGHQINNLAINTTADGYCGLLKNISGTYSSYAPIKNLTINNCTLYVSSDAQYVGALAAKPTKVSITNCSITGLLTVKLQANNGNQVYIGGLVGYPNSGALTISNCSIADIKYDNNGHFYTNNLFCGGLVGTFQPLSENCEITNCNVTISQESNYVQSTGGYVYFGGLVGATGSGANGYMKFMNTIVNITNLNVTSTTADCYAGAWIGKFTNYGGPGTIGLGSNLTSGLISAWHSSSSVGYTGNSSNKYICGQTAFTPSTSETPANLGLTISDNIISK